MTTTIKALKAHTPGWRAHHNIYKKNAEVRGIRWALTIKEVETLFAGDCFYCGDGPEERRFSTASKNPYVEILSGIDRVDPAGAYTVSNTVSACKACNKAKGYLGRDLFLRKCRQVAAKHP